MSVSADAVRETRRTPAAGRNAERGARETLRLGFLGLGWIGRKRLDAVAGASGVKIAALADSDGGRLSDAAAAYPDALPADDIEALLACDLDGVIIATPNAAHAAQATTCLSRGVPVFCQKPLGVTGAEAETVIEAARAADLLLGVDFSYRHVQGMNELRRRIVSGELGDILALDLVFHNAYGPDKPWVCERRLSGGGALLDLGVHLLDLALWLQSGSAPRLMSSRLFAHGKPLQHCDEIEDMAYAELRQTNGAVVRIACSWHAHTGCDAVIGFELLGSRGGARWRNVGGSFYDFALDIFKGRTAERIASPPDEWGPRALGAWLHRLRSDRSFDAEAEVIAQSARLIDEVYAA